VQQVKRSAAPSHSVKAADRQFFISVTPRQQSAYSEMGPAAACCGLLRPAAACMFTTGGFSSSDSLA